MCVPFMRKLGFIYIGIGSCQLSHKYWWLYVMSSWVVWSIWTFFHIYQHFSITSDLWLSKSIDICDVCECEFAPKMCCCITWRPFSNRMKSAFFLQTYVWTSLIMCAKFRSDTFATMPLIFLSAMNEDTMNERINEFSTHVNTIRIQSHYAASLPTSTLLCAAVITHQWNETMRKQITSI